MPSEKMTVQLEVETAFGRVTMGWRPAGLVSVCLGPYDAKGGAFRRVGPCVADPQTLYFLKNLERYFGGEPVRLDPPLDLDTPGTAFQGQVWEAARRIPWGEVRTYGWLAQQVGRPQAARSVGGALGRNPIPLVVPCHRVVPQRGGVGGFSAGLDWKRALLELEGAGSE